METGRIPEFMLFVGLVPTLLLPAIAAIMIAMRRLRALAPEGRIGESGGITFYPGIQGSFLRWLLHTYDDIGRLSVEDGRIRFVSPTANVEIHPADIEAIVPRRQDTAPLIIPEEFLAAQPIDFFGLTPLHLLQDETRHTIFSVGHNRIDDGGCGEYTQDCQEDLCLHIPLK